jgi:hypothetical protein
MNIQLKSNSEKVGNDKSVIFEMIEGTIFITLSTEYSCLIIKLIFFIIVYCLPVSY